MLAGVAVLATAAGLAPAAGAQIPAPVSAPTAGALYRDGQTGRYLLGGTWLYRADPGDAGVSAGYWANTADASGWSPVSVPNSFNAGDLSKASMAGSVGWYRRDFVLPAGAFAPGIRAADQFWIVRFESVNYRATVWLNGHQIGTHAGAYLPFELDLHGLRAGVNRLVVRVDSRKGPDDLPPGPGGGWWNFGGILREVYLRRVARVDIQSVQAAATFRCTGCAVTETETATLRNLTSRPQTVRLRGRFGTLPIDFGAITLRPGATVSAPARWLLRQPHLWSIADPYLYRASLSLTDSGSRATSLGGWISYLGVRQIAVTAGGRLTLNGRLLDLRGVFIHEQDVATGGVLSPARTAQLIGWTRGLGATLIRSHYPLSPELQEMADRDGLLIWSEIPVYQVPSATMTTPGWLTRTEGVLAANIATNGNHPSVLLWSIGNELATPVDAPEATYIAAAAKLAHQLDPTRPVGLAISSWPGVACQAAYAPLDVIGYNDYFGWYDAGGGTTDDRDALSPYLDFLRACYPTKALMVTEFGFEANRDGTVEERGTYQFQSDAMAFHLGVFATKPWLSGAIAFALQDFAVKPGWTGGNPLPDPPWLHKGLYDQYGNAKPAAAVVSAIYHGTIQMAKDRAR